MVARIVAERFLFWLKMLHFLEGEDRAIDLQTSRTCSKN